MYALVFYSHSDYSDVWPPMLEQANKYFPQHQKYLFSDETTEELNEPGWNLVRYEDSSPYQQRVVSCLAQVKEEIVLFHHEDMFLYGEPKYDALQELVEIITEDQIDIVKLICASYRAIDFRNITSLSYVYENPPDLRFAIQPSLCKTSALKAIYQHTGGANIWQFEALSSYMCKQLQIKTGMVFLPEDKKRGRFHWDSSIYPYFATAIVKGKWNFGDYQELLEPLLIKNDVDYNSRGIC